LSWFLANSCKSWSRLEVDSSKSATNSIDLLPNLKKPNEMHR
jgi:hypothetical protein